MSPRTRPEWVVGTTRITASALPLSRVGSHTSSQAFPDAPAPATTDSSSGLMVSLAGAEWGTDTASSSWPWEPVHTSAKDKLRVLRSDSATCKSSSSMGMARDSRLPNVRTTASGASRSPYTMWLAYWVSRWRAGPYRSADTAADAIDNVSRVRSFLVGAWP